MASGAAADFEHLALVLDAAGQVGAALDAARRAATLEASAARTTLVTRLMASATAPIAEPAEGHSGYPRHVTAAERASMEAAELAELIPSGPAAADARASEADLPRAPSDPVGGPVADQSDPGTAGGSWPAVDIPSPPPIVGPPSDPEMLMADAATALAAGDLPAARDMMLTAVVVHRSAGHLDAALDAGLQLLAVAPGDPRVHLSIANLQLDHGWNALATEKIELLLRLTSLTGDTQAEADAHGLAAERLRDGSTPAATAD